VRARGLCPSLHRCDRAARVVQTLLIGVCRDLTGIVSSTYNKKTYSWVFDALYPRHFPMFLQATEVRGAVACRVVLAVRDS
jgi:hypothetical protein